MFCLHNQQNRIAGGLIAQLDVFQCVRLFYDTYEGHISENILANIVKPHACGRQEVQRKIRYWQIVEIVTAAKRWKRPDVEVSRRFCFDWTINKKGSSDTWNIYETQWAHSHVRTINWHINNRCLPDRCIFGRHS